MLQIAEKRNANIFICRSRRILKSASKIKKSAVLFCVATNELKLDLNPPLTKFKVIQFNHLTKQILLLFCPSVVLFVSDELCLEIRDLGGFPWAA